ncbi:MAG: hypothetical protein JSR09_05905 [Bacteroidetes bacterium]|nr:hypothetical protein [Bacteroidota bacterium]
MKILSIFFFTALILLTIPSVGQKANPTRSETEAWLLEKMNKYVAKNTIDCNELFPGDKTSPFNKTTDCSTYTGVSFSFAGDNLIITANVKKTEYNDKGNIETNFTRKVTIPLHDLDNTFYITSNGISFSTKYSAIRVDDSNGKSNKQGYFSLWFNTNEEENFKTRFEKAMSHLRTFVKIPKSNEAF